MLWMVVSESTLSQVCENTHTEDVSQSHGIIAVFYLIIFSLCAHHRRIVVVFPDDYQDSEAQKWPLLQYPSLNVGPRVCCVLLESCKTY